MKSSTVIKFGTNFAMLAMFAACGSGQINSGSLKNPENYPNEIVKPMVDIYLANNADQLCSNIKINEDARDSAFNDIAVMVAAKNIDVDSFVEHWKSDETTSKEDTYFLTFYNKHNISFDETQHDVQFCAAMAKENAANTEIGKLINVR